MKKTIFVFLVTTFLTGCAVQHRLSTPSGRPEVLISNVSKKEVMDNAVNLFIGAGWEIKDITDYHAVFTKVDNSLTGELLFGSSYDSTPEYRVKFTFADLTGKIRVLCSASVVTNPGSAFERVKDATFGKNAQDFQTMLLNLKSSIELANKGIIGIIVNSANVITGITPGFSAEQAGLQVGDKINSVDGKPVSASTYNQISYMITGDVGTFVNITVVRAGHEITYKVERRKRQ
jgi:hypothetical protein